MMPTRWAKTFGQVADQQLTTQYHTVFFIPLSLYFTYLLYPAGVGAGVTYAVGHTAVYAELAVVTTPSVVLTSYTTDSVVMIHLDQGTNASSPFFVPSAGFAMDGSAPLQTVWRVVC